MSQRPDQLDQQVAANINRIRRETNDARLRLGLTPMRYPEATWVDYPVVTAEAVRVMQMPLGFR